MYINFMNKSGDNFIIHTEKENFPIEPEGFARVFFAGEKAVFSSEIRPVDFLDGFEDEQPEKLKDRLIYRAVKKLAEKLPETELNTLLTYELSDAVADEITVELRNGAYPLCAGNFADFFDMVPIVYSFARCETEEGTLKILKAKTNNRKEYLRLFRKIILFLDWGLILPDLFLFIPKYILAKVLTSNMCIARVIGGLYNLSETERTNVIEKRINAIDKEEENKGCLKSLLYLLLAVVIVAMLFIWANWEEIKPLFN